MASLTPEQQTIARTKTLSMSRPADDVIAFLKALGDYDVFVQKRAKFWGCSTGLVLVLGVAAGIIWLNVKKHHPMRGGSVIAGAVILSIICGVVWSKWKAADLSDNFRLSALPFLTVLRQDMNPQDALLVKIDLREATVKEKLSSEAAPYAAGAYYKVIDRVYIDPWFSGEATLADETNVQWQVTDRVLQRQRTKRNARGKHKTKTNLKVRTTAVVTLNFASKEYALEKVSESVKQKKKSVTLKKSLKTAPGEAETFNLLVELIAEGYKHLTVARTA